MWLLLNILTLIIAGYSSQLKAQGEVIVEIGNGGDVVYCSNQEPIDFPPGYYSLDYVTSFNYSNNNADIPNLSWVESSQRIIRILKLKAPHLGYSLEKFVKNLLNENDLTQQHVWRARRFGLVNLKDEALLEELPRNCLNLNDAGKVQLIQAVIREYRNDKILFSFDPKFFYANRLLDDLNFSYLVIHEWLWSFCPNARVLRDINNLLHSNQLETLSEKDFQLTLEQFGLLQNGEAKVSARSYEFYLDENNTIQIRGNSSPFLMEYSNSGGLNRNTKLKVYNSTNYQIEFISEDDNHIKRQLKTIQPQSESFGFFQIISSLKLMVIIKDPANNVVVNEMNLNPSIVRMN